MTAEHLKTILIVFFPVINVIAFIMCALDKSRSKRGGQRVRESSFVRISIVGGGAGTLLGFYALRHKTRHKRLLVTVWAVTVFAYGAVLWAMLA